MSQRQGEIPVRSWMTQIITTHQPQPGWNTKEFSHYMDYFQTGFFFSVFICRVCKIFCEFRGSIQRNQGWSLVFLKETAIYISNKGCHTLSYGSYFRCHVRLLVQPRNNPLRSIVFLPWCWYLFHPILQWCISRSMHSGVKRVPREHQNKWFAVSAQFLSVQQPCHFSSEWEK